MKTVTELLPLAIGIAVIGGITWLLLDRGVGFGMWLLAALLFAHGWVHMMFVFPQPEPAGATPGGITYPFDMGRSWLISGAGLDVGLIRTIGLAVMVATFAGFILAALSTVGVLVPAGWWAGLVVGSAIGSMLLLALFFSPALLLGFAIDLALLWLVLASIWSPVGGGTVGGVG
jgi:hypothetical protein